LRGVPNCKAVLLTHNDTSTAVQNDLGALAEVIHAESDALICVDAVSSAGGAPLATDAWELDMVATASQKAWMAPPGVGVIAVSKKAWAAHATSTMPKFYFDIAKYRQFLEIGQPPFTPALGPIYGLDLALQQLIDEGIENVIARHAALAEQTRAGIKRLGLSLFCDERVSSNTVTAIRVPEGVDGGRVSARMRDELDVEISGGQGPLAGKIWRIGHMGWCLPEHIDDCIDALENSLAKEK
jgi:aspartate aminotransferase-like enzyme